MLVFRDDDGALLPEPYLVHVITAAAPNARALRDRGWGGDLGPALHRRAERVLHVAAEHSWRRLVLGAWGCGVFGNDADEVAAAFGDLLHGRFAGSFSEVIFAVLDHAPGAPTRRAFERVFLPGAAGALSSS